MFTCSALVVSVVTVVVVVSVSSVLSSLSRTSFDPWIINTKTIVEINAI